MDKFKVGDYIIIHNEIDGGFGDVGKIVKRTKKLWYVEWDDGDKTTHAVLRNHFVRILTPLELAML